MLVEPIQSIQTALWEVGRVRHNKEKHTRLARVRRLVGSMQVATSLVTTNVLELRMEKWLSG